ncbi:hypothetical protein [Lactobacillus taiwanensis]|uniref:hypothetical protein n=1 Tax=Lactobacillus taiwanensis TaxID=508451 RepID=UPI00272CC63D|nr:hypothetical protein [Lactobacillus taiwanensis]
MQGTFTNNDKESVDPTSFFSNHLKVMEKVGSSGSGGGDGGNSGSDGGDSGSSGGGDTGDGENMEWSDDYL